MVWLLKLFFSYLTLPKGKRFLQTPVDLIFLTMYCFNEYNKTLKRAPSPYTYGAYWRWKQMYKLNTITSKSKHYEIVWQTILFAKMSPPVTLLTGCWLLRGSSFELGLPGVLQGFLHWKFWKPYCVQCAVAFSGWNYIAVAFDFLSHGL